VSVNVASIWAYAGIALREDEAGYADAARLRFLKARGWAYVEVLLGSGRDETNRGPDLIETAAASCRAVGLPLVGWFNPRPADVPISETVAMAHDCVQRYGLAAVRYQTETEFEYSGSTGTPASRYGAMQDLGVAHRALLPTIPTSIYTRGPLHQADAWWAVAWRYGFRPAVEIYGVTETPTGPFPPRLDFAEQAAKGSALPPVVGGWWYRVRLGHIIRIGRVTDDGKSVEVDGYGTFQLGTYFGPRFIDQYQDGKWGALLGFFPSSWLKPVLGPYPNPYTREKPSGAALAAEIRTWQRVVRRYGPATKGYSVWPGSELTDEHYAALSPTVLVGAALVP